MESAKTKYVLCGGFASGPDPRRAPFFAEMLAGAPDKAKVLLVYFARDPEKVSAADDRDYFEAARREGQTLVFSLADENAFLEQAKSADIIFLRGGNTQRLLAALSGFGNLAEHFRGKTVGGESAGAYALSKTFYSKSSGGLFEGLGLVPVNTICHYAGQGAEKLPEGNGASALLLADFERYVFWAK
jgi:peptidase E